MSDPKHEPGADLESPFLDEEILKRGPSSDAVEELSEDEDAFNEEEQTKNIDGEEKEEEEYAAQLDEREFDVSEECEDELESDDEGAAPEWEDLDGANDAAPFRAETDFLDSEVWADSADQIAFRDRVLAAHLARSKALRGSPQRDLRKDELEKVPGTDIETLPATAVAAGRLLAAANAELAIAQKAGDADALRTTRLSATSGYRGSRHQRTLWLGYFSRKNKKGYYNRTQAAREQLPEGPHSDQALAYMLRPKEAGGFGLRGRIAAPGYSNHQGGIAIDFSQERKKGYDIVNESGDAARHRWRSSWFHRWLKTNAATYGFKPIRTEEWHWEYRRRQHPPPRPKEG